MRRLTVAVLIVLAFSSQVSAAESRPDSPFAEALDKTLAGYVTPLQPADLVRAAVSGLVKFAPQSPAVPFAQSKLANLPNNRNAALAVFNAVFDKFETSGSPPPDQAALLDTAIAAMAGSLDPHSGYLSPSSFKEMQAQSKGVFGGVGVEVQKDDGLIRVVSPLDDSPAAHAGVLPGDLITAIDGASVVGMTMPQAVAKMRGDVNSPVTLTLQSKGDASAREVKLVREIIKINPVKARAEGDVGYIRITTFNEQAAAKVTEAAARLKQQIGPGLKGFVIDLRNDPGGLLNEVENVSDLFLERGVIVSITGRNPQDNKQSVAKPGDIADGQKIVLLINGGTASGSEIMAGALQDNHRATLLGSRSFGRGTVQTIIPLQSGGALRLTTSRYLTPAGRSIQARGIDPDIVVDQKLPPNVKTPPTPSSEASLPNHLKGTGEGGAAGSTAYVPPNPADDAQLQAALNLLNGSAPVAAQTPQPPPAPVAVAKTEPTPVSAPATAPNPSALGKRVALVIGNATYADQVPLKNPPADAKAIADALKSLGFSDVTLLNNLSKQAMEAALVEFAGKASSADWAVVYYAGHGMEAQGENFLIPVDAQLKQENQIRLETVPLEEVLDSAQGAKQLRLVILDACRENPFVPRMTRSSASRSVGRGLARIEPSGGELVAYSARDGEVAQDGDGANSPFVTALLEHIKDPGLDIRLMFARVRDKVLADTHDQQEPFTYGSLPGELLSFVPTPTQ